MRIYFREGRGLTEVFFNVKDNEYFVVHDPVFEIVEFSYEDSKFNTRSYYALNRQELRDAHIPDVMHENGIFDIPVFEFFTDHNFYINRHIISDLEREGIITVMQESEFKSYVRDKDYGKDYVVYDHNMDEVKPVEEFIKGAPAIRHFDMSKAERYEDQVLRDFGVGSIYDLRPEEVIEYGLRSEQNYRRIQYMYVAMDYAVYVEGERIRFWNEVARGLNFPDDVTIDPM